MGDIAFGVMARLPILKTRKSPGWAAFWGFMLGGIGLGIYFKSFIDFLFAVGAAIAVGFALHAIDSSSAAAYWLGAIVAAIYGALRAQSSNDRLAKAEAAE